MIISQVGTDPDLNEKGDVVNPELAVALSGKEMADLLEAVVERGVSFRFTATGGSMNPLIRNNDIVTISPVRDRKPRVGQVVAIRLPKYHRLVVHRIVRKCGNCALIRGDRGLEADGWIPVEKIMGVVTRVERNGKPVAWPWKGRGSGLAFLALGKLWARRVMGRGFRLVMRLAGKGRERDL